MEDRERLQTVRMLGELLSMGPREFHKVHGGNVRAYAVLVFTLYYRMVSDCAASRVVATEMLKQYGRHKPISESQYRKLERWDEWIQSQTLISYSETRDSSQLTLRKTA